MVVGLLLFTVALRVVRSCVPLVVCCWWIVFAACWLLLVACCWLFVMRCLSFVV